VRASGLLETGIKQGVVCREPVVMFDNRQANWINDRTAQMGDSPYF